MSKRKVAVVTGTRAEYGILKPLIELLDKSGNMELELLVTGMHLLESCGNTIDEIRSDGFAVSEVQMYSQNDLDEGNHGRALGRGIINFTDTLIELRPDFLILLGDRLEPLAAALAAATLKIPIAHIHGGDKTDSGHIDENIRHSITRFANIHFTATKEHSERLFKMGEEPWRIFEVGALGLDSILKNNSINKKEISRKLDLNEEQEVVVCLFHPVNLESELAGKQMKEILSALKDLILQTVLIYPNNDDGSKLIVEEIEKNRGRKFFHIFCNLKHEDFISLLYSADLLIGNSSSGIIEAPSLKLPVINVGSRNVGRDHAENVIYVKPKKELIKREIIRALKDSNFLNEVENCINPYGGGKTSERIVSALNNIKFDKKLVQKKIIY